MQHFPHLRKAVLLIFYDNGCINRCTSEESMLRACFKELSAEFTSAALQEVESELATFSDADLAEICCGEPSDDQLCSALADAVLTTAFETPIPRGES